MWLSAIHTKHWISTVGDLVGDATLATFVTSVNTLTSFLIVTKFKTAIALNRIWNVYGNLSSKVTDFYIRRKKWGAKSKNDGIC